MANPELGAKQICPNCQAKFYDLGKRPAHCPKCDTEFDPEEAVKTRRSRTRGATPDYDRDDAAEKPAVVDPDAEELEEEADDTPELDAVVNEPVEDDDDDTAAPGTPSGGDSDLGVGIEEEDSDLAADDDVPFLEDEEDDDAFDDDIEGIPGEDEER